MNYLNGFISIFFSRFSPMLCVIPAGERAPENMRNLLPLTQLTVRFPTGLFAHTTIPMSTKECLYCQYLPQSPRAFFVLLILTNQTPANYSGTLTRKHVERERRLTCERNGEKARSGVIYTSGAGFRWVRLHFELLLGFLWWVLTLVGPSRALVTVGLQSGLTADR